MISNLVGHWNEGDSLGEWQAQWHWVTMRGEQNATTAVTLRECELDWEHEGDSDSECDTVVCYYDWSLRVR